MKPARKRFKIYILDSGWESPAHGVLEDSLAIFTRHLSRHEVYVLGRKRSDDFLEDHPQWIGKDPIIAVIDPERMSRPGEEYGACLFMGHVHSRGRARMLLKMLLRLVNTPETASRLPAAIREAVHREGVRGTMNIIFESAALLENEVQRPRSAPEEEPDEDE